MVEVSADTYAKAAIESSNFPATLTTNVAGNWSAVVHNIGSTGTFGLAIVNKTGNPSTFIVNFEGSDYQVEPGYMLVISTENAVNCTRISLAGTIKFTMKGSYNLGVWGVHKETLWVVDDDKSKTVVVSDVPTPEKPWWEDVMNWIVANPVIFIASIIGFAGIAVYALKD